MNHNLDQVNLLKLRVELIVGIVTSVIIVVVAVVILCKRRSSKSKYTITVRSKRKHINNKCTKKFEILN